MSQRTYTARLLIYDNDTGQTVIDKAINIEKTLFDADGKLDFPSDDAPAACKLFICSDPIRIGDVMRARHRVIDVVLGAFNGVLKEWMGRNDTKMGYPKDGKQ